MIRLLHGAFAVAVPRRAERDVHAVLLRDRGERGADPPTATLEGPAARGDATLQLLKMRTFSKQDWGESDERLQSLPKAPQRG